MSASRIRDRSGWMNGALASLPACPPFPAFTAFERAALKAIAEEFGDEAAAFLAQIASSKVVDRINTIVGFYTRVDVDRTKCKPLEIDRHGGWFEIEGIEDGITVLLYGVDGYLETIEGVSSGHDVLAGRNLADLTFTGVHHLG